MDEQWLGTMYCLLACAIISIGSVLIWNAIDKLEKIIENYRDRKNKWK